MPAGKSKKIAAKAKKPLAKSAKAATPKKGKKPVPPAKRAASRSSKAPTRPTKTVATNKAAAKKAAAPKKPAVAKKAAPAKKAASPKKAPAKKAAAKKPTPAPKGISARKVTAAAKSVLATKPGKVAKTVVKAAAVAATSAKVAQRVAAKAVAAVMPPPAPAKAAKPAEAPKRARRPRTRIISNGTPVAAWLTPGGVKPRPSSFIPAPPRAESPSQIAAPPATSDRVLRPDDLENISLPAIRTLPVRVEIEQAVGRTHILVQPSDVAIHAGDGVEWDFRYLGGADTFIDEVVIELPSRSFFGSQKFRSKNPGFSRPHRQLSGRVSDNAAKGPVTYTIRCYAFGAELASTTARLTIS